MALRSQCSTYRALFLTILSALSTPALAQYNAMTAEGCYSSSTPLTDNGAFNFQTSGHCQTVCVPLNKAVLATTNGTNCFCGDQLPALSSKVDDSKCNTPCDGYGTEMCGGNNYWSVWLSGISKDVSNYGGSDSSSSSASSPTSTSAAVSVITSISPDHTTIVQTVVASSTNTPPSSGGGTSTAGIAAGVVVGVLGAAAIIGGVFFFLRHRRQRQAEENYKQSAQVSDFMRKGAERKGPNTAYSQMSDQRLDPEAGRRNSVGSMADDQDYSRRILRVANPDSH